MTNFFNVMNGDDEVAVRQQILSCDRKTAKSTHLDFFDTIASRQLFTLPPTKQTKYKGDREFWEISALPQPKLLNVSVGRALRESLRRQCMYQKPSE